MLKSIAQKCFLLHLMGLSLLPSSVEPCAQTWISHRKRPCSLPVMEYTIPNPQCRHFCEFRSTHFWTVSRDCFEWHRPHRNHKVSHDAYSVPTLNPGARARTHTHNMTRRTHAYERVPRTTNTDTCPRLLAYYYLCITPAITVIAARIHRWLRVKNYRSCWRCELH